MSIVTMYAGDPHNFELINPTSATGLTHSLLYPTTGAAAGKMARAVYISVETNSISLAQHGATATTSVGNPFAAGDSILIIGAVALQQISMIDKSGAADVKVTYYY